MNKLGLEGNWNLIKGKLKKRYACLTDNDLLYKGKKQELIGRIQRKVKTKREIYEILSQL